MSAAGPIVMWAQEVYGLDDRDVSVAVPGEGIGFLAARDVNRGATW